MEARSRWPAQLANILVRTGFRGGALLAADARSRQDWTGPLTVPPPPPPPPAKRAGPSRYRPRTSHRYDDPPVTAPLADTTDTRRAPQASPRAVSLLPVSLRQDARSART